jgi:hypothetical protein
MIERALPLPHQEIAQGEGHAGRRLVSASPLIHNLAARLMRIWHAVGAFFAAGGALS